MDSTLSFDPESAEFSWTPGDEHGGVYMVTFGVSDGVLDDTIIVNIIIATPKLGI